MKRVGYITKGGREPTVGQTETSEHVLPPHEQRVTMLPSWHDEGWEMFVCRAPRKSDYVLPDEHGNASRPRSANCPRADLERLREPGSVDGRPYQFRHMRTSSATRLRRAGTDIETSVRCSTTAGAL